MNLFIRPGVTEGALPNDFKAALTTCSDFIHISGMPDGSFIPSQFLAGVSVGPGTSTVTSTPCFFNSTCSASPKFRMYALAAE